MSSIWTSFSDSGLEYCNFDFSIGISALLYIVCVYGCLLYADDIVLLAHSLDAIRQMLRICDEFAIDFDMKFNSSKPVVMRIGERYKVKCEPLILACLLYTSPSPRDRTRSRMPSSA